MIDINPLIEAARNKLQVTINYTKQNGEFVSHTGGIYEIGNNSKGNDVVWLWDTMVNDHIRQFLVGNINSFSVLSAPFMPPQPYPIIIYGETVG